MRKFLLAVLILLTGCALGEQPAGTELPITPEIIRIEITSELAPLREAVAFCGSLDPQAFLIYEETLAPARPSGDAITFLIGTALGDTPSYQIGQETFAIILNPLNPVSKLTKSEVNSILTGTRTAWQGFASPIDVWLPLKGSASHQVIQSLLGETALTPNAQYAPSPGAMLSSVSESPGAIGILPAAWLTSDVKTAWQSASFPVLASIAGSPPGAAELIGCLQSGEGMELLGGLYLP